MQIIRVKAPIYYLLVGFGVCCFLLGSSMKSNTAPRQLNPSVKSLVPKLEVIQTKMLGPHVLEVIMKNNYSKDITAVVAAIGDYKVTRTGFMYAEAERDQKLSPGATYDFSYTVDSSEEENIVIKAVVFSDSTFEGDFKEVKEVMVRRRGVKIQVARLNSYLENFNKVAKLNKVEMLNGMDYARVQTEFQRVRQFAENLPIKPDGDIAMSRGLESGLRFGKDLILSDLSITGNLLDEEKNLDHLKNKKPMSVRYDEFRNKLLRVEKYFKSIEERH